MVGIIDAVVTGVLTAVVCQALDAGVVPRTIAGVLPLLRQDSFGIVGCNRAGAARWNSCSLPGAVGQPRHSKSVMS
jgi:hypothetical protein